MKTSFFPANQIYYIIKNLQNRETFSIQLLTQIKEIEINFDEGVESNQAILSEVL